MTTTFLMCRPDYFGVDYVINPWMQHHVHAVNRQLAYQQWQDFYTQLKRYAQVELISPQPKSPDLVFTANARLVLDHHIILSRFRYPQRRNEESIFRHWFKKNDFHVSELDNDICFEGNGDAIFHSDKSFLWLGYGFRSELSSATQLKKLISIPIKTLELVNEKFYHLDTCFCPLLDGYIMYYPAAFSEAAQHLLTTTVPAEKHIVVDDDDAARFACNAVVVKTDKISPKKAIIFVNSMSSTLSQRLNTLGYEVRVQPVSEFQKSGGANLCLTLKLSDNSLMTRE